MRQGGAWSSAPAAIGISETGTPTGATVAMYTRNEDFCSGLQMDVVAWLERLGLGRYAETFARNDIDREALDALTDGDLRELGVASLGHRKKLLAEIAKLKATAPQAAALSPGGAPQHLAEKILRSRAALEGERKQVTVLFADIVGSTGLIEGLDPEQAAARLLPALQAMMAAVHRYEGTVNKVQGDGIMALFGAPLAHEDHALRACYAALAMQEAARRDLKDGLGIRVGLHSGEVVVRSIGNDLSMDYDAIGPTVHLAGRMEQLAAPGTIRLTRDTYRLVEGFVEASPLGPTSVKGVSEPIELYELRGSRSMLSAWDVRAARGLSEFVGRETELAALGRALEEASAGQGKVVAIVGEPGLGKSRLAHEFIRTAAAQGWMVLESGASPHDRNTTYFPIRGLLRMWFRMGGYDTQTQVADKLRDGVASLDAGLLVWLPALCSLLDLPADAAWQSLEPALRRRRIIAAIKTLLLRGSQAAPLLVLIEDLHWIDAETQAVLDSLVGALAGVQLLLIVTHRPEYLRGWSNRSACTSIRLAPLAPVAADRLLRTLLGGDDELASLRRLLVERTDGTPLFIEEAVRSLADTGAITGERACYRLAARVDDIRVPSTVHAVLAARIDRLSMEARTLLQIASVIGAEVPIDLLQPLADLREDELRETLAKLCASELLYEAHPLPELTYNFKHALIHDVAYHGILRERRRALHARLVAGIEARYRDRLEEHTERLAHHAWNGELWEKAALYLHQAGDRAVERSAYRQAAGFFRQALDALARLPASSKVSAAAIDIRIKLRPTLAPIGESGQILGYLREAEDLAAAAGDRRRLVLSLIHQSYLHSVQGDMAEAVIPARRAADIAAAIGDRALAIETRIALGQAYCFGGEARRAIEVLTPDLDYLTHELRHERFGQISTRSAMALMHLTNAHETVGEFAAAIDFGKAACTIADEVRRPADIGSAQLRLGSCLLHKGDVQEALPILKHAHAVLEAGEISFNVPLASAYISHAHALQGDAAEVSSGLRREVERCAAMRLTRSEAWLRAFLSHARLRSGAPHEAAEEARQALVLARRHRYLDVEAFALRLHGMAEIAGGRTGAEEGQEKLHEAIALSEARELRPELAHGHRELGLFFARTGRAEEGHRHLANASSLYRAMDMRFWLPEIEAALVDIGASE
jgi:class 3 adenylate cyclase/tetratricopeptide (TPR) repeat protein